MSISSAQVRDFQSIADVSVTFGDFTVLVGPSNSGKSAFLRALRACLRNTFVPANVRQGTTTSVVDVVFEDTTVGIERGKSLSTYKVGAAAFTKSGRTVPPEVARAIRLPLIEGVDATFSFQFDRPFLLADPGSTAASVIGSLTNVSMLHTAVREANRRRSEAAATLKVRDADVARYTAQISEYRGLKARKTALLRAEELLAFARDDADRLAALRRATDVAAQAQVALNILTAVPPVDVSAALAEAAHLVGQAVRLDTAIAATRRTVAALKAAAAQARSQRDQASQAESEHAYYLRDLGTCPTCGTVTQPLSS